MSRFKYVRTDYGNYEVFIRGRLLLLGVIEKRGDQHRDWLRSTPRYYWVASRAGQSIKDGGGQVAARFDTREQAAEALLQKLREGQ